MKNRIRELRAEKNITQLRLSMELEVSQETVSAYENGKHLPSLKSLIKMADLFHVSTDYLIGRSDVRKPSPDEPLPNEDLALLDCFTTWIPSTVQDWSLTHRGCPTNLQKTEKNARTFSGLWRKIVRLFLILKILTSKKTLIVL